MLFSLFKKEYLVSIIKQEDRCDRENRLVDTSIMGTI